MVRAVGFVVQRQVMLGAVDGPVGFAGGLIKAKLILGVMVSQPV